MNVCRSILLLVFFACSMGCRDADIHFSPNQLMATQLGEQADVDMTEATQSVTQKLDELFGTPDEPKWPGELLAAHKSPSGVSLNLVVDKELLLLGGGAVGRNDDKIEKGVYRKHCAACHGITGDGFGPTARLLNPYPRDFRRGTFKYKSTISGAKPLDSDLHRTLVHGLAGTGMPSFVLLKESEHFAGDIDTLVNYVKYLSIRGEVERELLRFFAFEIDEGGSISEKEVESILIRVVSSWENAENQTIVPQTDAPNFFSDAGDSSVPLGDEFWESVRRGEKLFHSATTACATCHGIAGSGEGSVVDFDEWTKDWTTRSGIDPNNEAAYKPLKKLGALPPRPAEPRNLQSGVFRGGDTPSDVYLRLVGGINGSPMPPVSMQPAAGGLSAEQVWDLVNYVLALSRNDAPPNLKRPDLKQSPTASEVSEIEVFDRRNELPGERLMLAKSEANR